MYVINHHIVPKPSSAWIQTEIDPQMIVVASQKEFGQMPKSQQTYGKFLVQLTFLHSYNHEKEDICYDAH